MRVFLAFATIGFLTIRVSAQPASEDVGAQLRALADQLAQMRQELTDARRESSELRRELQTLKQQLGAETSSVAGVPLVSANEEQELLAAKVEDQYQTKVESGSKNRVTLSGMAVVQAVAVRGAVDSLDLPSVAVEREPGESGGALGASIRQTMLGLDVIGPTLAGAKTRGDVRVDFFGGLPTVPDGATSGFVRLRTAKFVMDWSRSSLVVGQDVPFISPLSPSSLLNTAYPALAGAGNLWSWIPQAYLSHNRRVSESTNLVVSYGVLDPLTGELPRSEYSRTPTAGERSRIPAVATRVGIAKSTPGTRAAAGVSGYYSRQNWGFSRRVDSWVVTADWELPLSRFFSLQGEFYRGRALGGLGGGVGSTVLRTGELTDPVTRVMPIDSRGGWAQLKFKPVQRWEWNVAYGADLPGRPKRPLASVFGDEEPTPKRNRSALANVIYQPRNNLLFSVEYRKLWTSPFDARRSKADHVGIAAGVMF